MIYLQSTLTMVINQESLITHIFLYRPFLFPLTLVSCGFCYGNYKVLNAIYATLLGVDASKLSTTKKLQSHGTAVLIGAAIFYKRGPISSDTPPADVAKAEATVTAKAASIFTRANASKIVSNVRSMIPGIFCICNASDLKSNLSSWHFERTVFCYHTFYFFVLSSYSKFYCTEVFLNCLPVENYSDSVHTCNFGPFCSLFLRARLLRR